jgi:hypothetical protein
MISRIAPDDLALIALYTRLGVRDDVLHFDIAVDDPSRQPTPRITPLEGESA